MRIHSISNRDDVIDSRDIIARIDELTSERESLTDAVDETDEEGREAASEEVEAWDESPEGEELATLSEIADCGVSDWSYGVPLVRESYFTEYCKEMLEDCGDLPKNFPDYIVIDWEKTADNLKEDYTEVDYDGVTYLVR